MAFSYEINLTGCKSISSNGWVLKGLSVRFGKKDNMRMLSFNLFFLSAAIGWNSGKSINKTKNNEKS